MRYLTALYYSLFQIRFSDIVIHVAHIKRERTYAVESRSFSHQPSILCIQGHALKRTPHTHAYAFTHTHELCICL